MLQLPMRLIQATTKISIGALVLALVAGCQSPGGTAKNPSQGTCPVCAANPSNHKLAGTPFVTDWLAPAQRANPIRGIDFDNQDGVRVSFSELRGAPAAIGFVYTRSDSEPKCPLVARTLGELALLVQDTPVSPKPSFLLLGYDPELDTPSELKTFASTREFRGTPRAMLLGSQSQTRELRFSNRNVRVNHSERDVSRHGIQLILLDKQGRYVRTYHSRLWDNAQVLSDLARLAAE
jgi:cytochrome oxidase Cu insertion factor (SCO1/SenC/PrrC family)